MSKDTPLPALRPVEVTAVEHEGVPHFSVGDNLEIAEANVLLSQPAFFIAAHLDGEASCADIQALMRETFNGFEVPEALILEVVEFLDGRGYLMTERFTERFAAVRADFLAAPTRPAWHAGRSYPEDREELDDYFLRLFAAGPEIMPAAPGAGAPLRCLVVPHLDYGRGAAGYSAGFKRLYGSGTPETVFIFGVAHAGAGVPFVLTRKDYETPFGTLAVDTAAIDALEEACAWDPYAWELVHRAEHSIEFQANLIAWMYGTDVKIVPILTGSFEMEEDDDGLPEEAPAIHRFLTACRDYASVPGRHVTMIASADLAHMGESFGDDFPIDAVVAEAVEKRDRDDLEHVLAGDGVGWYRSVMADDNARRVCGVGCTFGALLAARPGKDPAELLAYGQAENDDGGFVSYAAVALP